MCEHNFACYKLALGEASECEHFGKLAPKREIFFLRTCNAFLLIFNKKLIF